MCSVKIFDYKINADLNKNVFNLDLKIARTTKNNEHESSF